jgi:hypothetical protein
VRGFADGTILLRGLTFDGAPSAKVTALARGPSETIVAGFDDGVVAVFGGETGRKLHEIHLEGPIAALVADGPRVLAISELGATAMIDLSVLESDYCSLLRDVWAAIPVVWSRGGAVSRPPPDGHRCRR